MGDAATGIGEARPRPGPLHAILTANAISLIGNQLTTIAVPWFVLETTGSAARTGLVAAATLAPTVLASFFGGALVDRLSFKRVSVVADLASAGTTATIPLLHFTVGLAFWQLLVLVFLGALLDAPGGTARISLIPDLVALSGTSLERANAISQTIRSVASLFGPLLAGTLIVAFNAGAVLWIDAATFIVSAILVGFVVPSPPERAPTGEANSYLRDVVGGIRFLAVNRLLRTILAVAAAVNFLISPLLGVMLPVYAEARYDRADALGAMLAGVGAGSLLGSLIFGAIGATTSRRLLMIGGLLAIGMPFPLLAAEPPIVAAVVALAVSGVAMGIINPMLVTLLQVWTPTEMRGRVFGTFDAVVLIAAPLGMLLAGAASSALGVNRLLVVAGCALVLIAASLLPNPTLRALDESAPDPVPST